MKESMAVEWWPDLSFEPINLWSVFNMSKMNRLGNVTNPYQGKTKKVLCVCSAGLLRSPTAAVVLSQEPFNYNTRAVGMNREFALIPVDDVLIEWADEVVVMENWMAVILSEQYPGTKITLLGIEDSFSYRDPRLMTLIRERYKFSQGYRESPHE